MKIFRDTYRSLAKGFNLGFGIVLLCQLLIDNIAVCCRQQFKKFLLVKTCLADRRAHNRVACLGKISLLKKSGISILSFAWIVLFLLSIQSTNAQVKYPVTTNVNVGAPQPVYLSDYYQPASNNLLVNLVLNDLNEPFWNARLKFTITGTDLKIVTKTGLRPSQPVELTSGTMVTLRDEQLMEYLSPDRVIASGAAAGLFNQTGRLKEGIYNLCVEVLDYNSGTPISLPACATMWIQLKEPPMIISPMCKQYIAPIDPQNILFQWQPVTIGPNVNANIQYSINIYELTDYEANPQLALQNGQALRVFESDPIMGTSYVYDIADPLLEVGKRYIYTVRAFDYEGKDFIKNNGNSEVCDFYYGYPEGGVITLRLPEAGYAYGYDETPEFEWNSTNRRIPNQPFAYELKIVKVQEGQDSIAAMEENDPWYSYTMSPTTSVTFKKHTLRQVLDPLYTYAWKIFTYSGEQMVAESEVQTFVGPPFLDKFNAGGYIVEVLKTDNQDLNDLKGKCRLALGKDTLIANFDHLQLNYVNMKYFLEKGEIVFDDVDVQDVPLAPQIAEIDTAYFQGDQVKLSKKGLKVHGFIQLAFPHPTFDTEPPVITTRSEWFDFAMMQITGMAKLEPGQNYDLLDPMGFNMALDESSVLIIDRGKYKSEYNGLITLPEDEKIGKVDDLNLNFKASPHLMYFDKEALAQELRLPLLRRTNFSIDAEQLTFDLSDEKSPGIHAENTLWKGLYFDQYAVNIFQEVDEKEFWNPDMDHVVGISQPNTESFAWVAGGGLNFSFDYDFTQSDTADVYTFDGKLSHLKIRITDRSVENSELTGGIFIPFVSESKRFDFKLPLTYNGFTAGYLSGLEGYKYVFNNSSLEQKVPVEIVRAEFEGNDRITFSMDFDFPTLNANVPVVSDFKIWGNGEIGFRVPNGSLAFDKQINGKVSTYPIVVEAIGAGRNKNYYSIAIQLQVNMSEDISGLEGAPISNFYSVAKNTLLDEEYEPVEVESGGGMWNPVLGSYDESTLEDLSDDEIAQVIAFELESALNSNPDEDRELIDDLLSAVGSEGAAADSVDTSVPDLGDTNGITVEEELSRSGVFAGMSDKEAALVEAIVETFVDEITRPITQSIDGMLTKFAYKADSTIAEKTKQAEQLVATQVDKMMLGINANLAGMVNNEVIQDLLITAVTATSKSIKEEAFRSLELSVAKVIREPIVSDFSVVIPDRINDTIRTTLTKMVVKMLEGKLDGDYIKKEVGGNLWATTKGIGEYVFDQYIKPEALVKRIEGLGNEFVASYDWNNVLNNIKSELTSPDLLANTVISGYGEELLSKTLGNSAAGNELISAGMSMSRSLSFKDGKLKLDPSNINIETSWLSFTGVTNFRGDDPVYGDVWDADVTIVIHKPKDMSFKGRYMNGRTKEGTDFWFAELSTASKSANGTEAGGKDIGGDIAEDIKPMERPINLGVAKIAAASLRVYKHMIDTTGAGIIPDPNIKYGGYFHFVLLDGKKDGKIFRLELEGNVLQGYADDAFILDFLGDLQIVNKSPKIEEPDDGALTHAGISIHYNGLEDHFLGYAFLEITRGVCLSASMEIESKPGYWHVYIGDEYNKIKVTPGCVAWGGMGYMKLDNKTLELALGVSYSLYFNKELKFGIGSLGILVDAYAALGIVAGIQYDPSFKLLKAGLWLELYAKVMLNYSIKLGFVKKSGSIELLEFFLRASLVLTFEPKPSTMVGDAEGYLRILNGLIKTNFKAHLEKRL